MKRRSRFELLVEIIELCKFPGITKTYLTRNVRTNRSVVNDILFGLIEDKLIKIETRPHGRLGQKRDTDYFIQTPDAENLIQDVTGLKERLTRSGTQPR